MSSLRFAGLSRQADGNSTQDAPANRLRRGELDPRVANAIAYMATVLLRAIEQGPMEQRISHLEAILGKSRAEFQTFSFRSEKEAGK